MLVVCPSIRIGGENGRKRTPRPPHCPHLAEHYHSIPLACHSTIKTIPEKTHRARAAASRGGGGRRLGGGGGGGGRAAAGRATAAAVADGDVGRAAGEVALGGDDLVVVRAELQAQGGPRVKVRADVDGAGRALVLADRPVLLEGRGTLDRGLVGAGRLVDVVDGAVRGDAAELGGARGGVVGAEVLDDVVLDQGVLGPAVDREVGVAVGAVATRVVDGAKEGGLGWE